MAEESSDTVILSASLGRGLGVYIYHLAMAGSFLVMSSDFAAYPRDRADNFRLT